MTQDKPETQKSADKKSEAKKSEAKKAAPGNTKRVATDTTVSAENVVDQERLKSLSTGELAVLMVDIALLLKDRTAKDTEQISTALTVPAFPDTDSAEPQKFVRLPRTFKGDPSVVAAKMWKITLTSSQSKHAPLGLELCDDAVVGRHYKGGPEPDLDLMEFDGEDLGVSRQHAMLRPTPDGLLLADLGSTNGTYCNGKKVALGAPHKMSDGDTVSFGELHFKVGIVSQPEKKKAS